MTDRYERAILLAVRAHHGQERWNKEPYVCHTIRVAIGTQEIMKRELPSCEAISALIEDAKIAAILHDTVEDTSVTIAEIREQFGGTVADTVDHLTNRKDESYADFIERAAKNYLAIRVKIADLLDNSVGLKPDSPRAQKYEAALARLRPLLTGGSS